MPLLLALAFQAAQADAITFDLANVSAPANPSLVARCDARAHPDEIVICASRQDRYRLPLPVERDVTRRVPGDVRTGLAVLDRPGRCGIFAGERRCDRREAAEYGYGNGRDPVTVLTRLAGKIADPDAD